MDVPFTTMLLERKKTAPDMMIIINAFLLFYVIYSFPCRASNLYDKLTGKIKSMVSVTSNQLTEGLACL